MVAPERCAYHEILAAWVPRLLGSWRSTERCVEHTGVSEPAALAKVLGTSKIWAGFEGMADRAGLLVGTRDHGDQERRTCWLIDETRRPAALTAGDVDDFVFRDSWIAHGRSPQGAGQGTKLTGELEGLDEEAPAIGETIKEVVDLGLVQTVVDVAVVVSDHGVLLVSPGWVGPSSTKTWINP